MAGIYLHIPFCKQACHYCDFHFSTNTGIRKDLLQAMAAEISLQRNYLGGEILQTVYFGGGTPSMLEADEIGFLMEHIKSNHRIAREAEITMEANPDDLSPDKLRALRSSGINRLSIGIQSFDDTLLTWLNRSHSSEAAIESVAQARACGFTNISIDLIYAIPGLTNEKWRGTIQKALALDLPHISAYTLTIEEKTTFGNWLKKGRLQPVSDTIAAQQMEILVAELAARGYRHYEISNFARPGFESVHNSNYWRGEMYLGIGPSAHSFNKKSRQHNVSNNHLYVRAIQEQRVPAEPELLKREEQINEYILTSLRTDTGCDLGMLRDQYAYDVITLHHAYIGRLMENHLVRVDNDYLQLTEEGRLLADQISSDLFLIE